MKFLLYTILFSMALFNSGCAFMKTTKTDSLNSAGAISHVNAKSEFTNAIEEKSITDKDETINSSIALEKELPEMEERQAEEISTEIAENEVASKEIEAVDPSVYLDAALQLYAESQEFWSLDNSEKAMTSLDEAYQNILNIDSEINPQLEQQIENLRIMISKRILEIYASKYRTVNGHNDAIPLVMNAHVEREIKSFQRGESRFFIESYRRSGKYREKIVAELKKAGIPEELSWLPLIESGFKVKALSRARALGLWQFIPSTGYKFNLNRNGWIDERLDPEKSTHAAIAYLKQLHQIFGDWSTVLAAYNCGETRVLKLIRRQKINYLDNFWDLHEKLPRETARYVPRFLATLHILKDPEKYGINLGEPASKEDFTIVSINKQMHLKNIAKQINVPLRKLSELNAVLRHKITPKTAFNLKVPKGKETLLLAQLDKIPQASLPKKSFKTHYVKRGETLSHIADRYRTSIRRIARANNINGRYLIRIGQKLKIPAKGVPVKRRYASKRKLSPSGIYNVRRGDSLWSIARRFKTTMEEIKKLNDLKSTTIRVNQRLKISKL